MLMVGVTPMSSILNKIDEFFSNMSYYVTIRIQKNIIKQFLRSYPKKLSGINTGGYI